MHCSITDITIELTQQLGRRQYWAVDTLLTLHNQCKLWTSEPSRECWGDILHWLKYCSLVVLSVLKPNHTHIHKPSLHPKFFPSFVSHTSTSMLGRSLGMRLTYAISIQKFTATYSGGHRSSNIHQNSKTCEMCTGTLKHSIVLIHICPLQSLKWPCSIPNPCVQKMTLHTFILLCELLITTSTMNFWHIHLRVNKVPESTTKISVIFLKNLHRSKVLQNWTHIHTRCYLLSNQLFTAPVI